MIENEDRGRRRDELRAAVGIGNERILDARRPQKEIGRKEVAKTGARDDLHVTLGRGLHMLLTGRARYMHGPALGYAGFNWHPYPSCRQHTGRYTAALLR